VSDDKPVEFAAAVLRSLKVLVPSGQPGADLACELGLSAWMRLTDTDIEDAPRHLRAVRQAILEAGGLDASTEPIPMGGRSSRLDLLNQVVYLGHLLARAAAHQECDADTMISRALEQSVVHEVTVRVSRVRELRSS
jgi:hypothetical protein